MPRRGEVWIVDLGQPLQVVRLDQVPTLADQPTLERLLDGLLSEEAYRPGALLRVEAACRGNISAGHFLPVPRSKGITFHIGSPRG